MYNLTVIYTEPFLLKKVAYLCFYAVTLMYLLFFVLGMVMYANEVETKEK